MRTTQSDSLTEIQLLHQVWSSDLEIALHEVNLWEELLNSLNEESGGTLIDLNGRNKIDQLHHFRRLANQLLDTVKALDEQMAANARIDHVLGIGSHLNETCLREEMNSFHTSFRTFKAEIRQYVTAQPTF